MGINFPNAPLKGDVYNGYIFDSAVWRRLTQKTALPRNYIVNPAMQISQENGRALSSTPAGTASLDYYAADQWWMRAGLAGTGRVRTASWTDPTILPASAYTTYLETTVAQASMGTGDYALLTHLLEGTRIKDWMWGTPTAQQLVMRFLINSTNVGGKFSVRLTNNGATRTYIASFTLVANTWTWVTLVIPGDTIGTWVTDTGRGAWVDFCFGIGSNFVGVEGWQSGDLYATPGQASALTTAGWVHVTYAGLYADPYKTGVAPPFVTPSFMDEMYACQRYWARVYGLGGVAVSSTVIARATQRLPVPMRVTPSGAIRGTPRMYDMGVTSAMTSLANNSNQQVAEFDVTVGAAGYTGGRPGMNYYQDDTAYVALSARL